MQEKEWNKLNFPNGVFSVYKGIPLFRDVIIKTKDYHTIIGELKHVSLYDNGDILYLQTNSGKENIDSNNIEMIDLYIEEEKFELGDTVEIVNIYGLNRVLQSKYIKGGKELIGLQGSISKIDNVTCKNVPYYLIDLPMSKYFKIKNENCIEDNNYVLFLKENLKLIKKGNDVKVDSSRFFDPSKFKPLNYKDLDGKTLKMTVVDNEECLLVAGVDKENNTIYMLHSEVK